MRSVWRGKKQKKRGRSKETPSPHFEPQRNGKRMKVMHGDRSRQTAEQQGFLSKRGRKALKQQKQARSPVVGKKQRKLMQAPIKKACIEGIANRESELTAEHPMIEGFRAVMAEALGNPSVYKVADKGDGVTSPVRAELPRAWALAARRS